VHLYIIERKEGGKEPRTKQVSNPRTSSSRWEVAQVYIRDKSPIIMIHENVLCRIVEATHQLLYMTQTLYTTHNQVLKLCSLSHTPKSSLLFKEI